MRNIHRNNSKNNFSPAHPYRRQCSILSPHRYGHRTLYHSLGSSPTFLLILWLLLLQGPPENVGELRGEGGEVEWAVHAFMCIYAFVFL